MVGSDNLRKLVSPPPFGTARPMLNVVVVVAVGLCHAHTRQRGVVFDACARWPPVDHLASMLVRGGHLLITSLRCLCAVATC
jgi:hypothetical protein